MPYWLANSVRAFLLAVASFLFLSTANAQTTQGCSGASFSVPDGQTLMCSKSYQFSAPCTGGDMVYNWSITGSPAMPSWHVTPWESVPISIVGIEITDMTPGDGHGWWMVGNDYVSDPMLFLGAGQNDAKIFYPSGYVWVFPSNVSPPANAYMDLHGLCTAGQPASVMVTYYYIGGATAGPPPPPPICSTFDSLNPADKSALLTLSNANLTVTNSGASTHGLVRAVTGIAPSTLKVHYEWTWTGPGSVDIAGLQDGAVSTATPVANGGTGVGVGYSTSAGYVYTANWPTSGALAVPVMASGTYAIDYDSFSGVATITYPGGHTESRTMGGTPLTVFPAFSLYSTPVGTFTVNFGATPFTYPVPAGFQAGLCQ